MSTQANKKRSAPEPASKQPKKKKAKTKGKKYEQAKVCLVLHSTHRPISVQKHMIAADYELGEAVLIGEAVRVAGSHAFNHIVGVGETSPVHIDKVSIESPISQLLEDDGTLHFWHGPVEQSVKGRSDAVMRKILARSKQIQREYLSARTVYARRRWFSSKKPSELEASVIAEEKADDFAKYEVAKARYERLLKTVVV